MSTNLLSTLTSIPNNAIIAFINDFSKKVYILQGSKVRTLLMQNLTQIEDGEHNHLDSLDNYRLEVIETCYDRTHRLLHTEYWYNQYEKIGYEVMARRCLLKYRYRIVLNKQGLVVVSAVSRRNDQIIVGVFRKLKEAEEFVLYADGQLVYANTELTRQCLCTGR